MGVTDRVWGALTAMIKLEDKVTQQAEALKSQQLKIEDLTARVIRLEAQLEENARAFVNDPTKNRFDREHHVAYLSKIFEWFEPDFRAHGESLLNYVRRYVGDPELAADLATQPYRIEFLDYDWHLNGVPYAGES